MNLTQMLADLEELVRCESFSADHQAVARSAAAVAAQGSRLLDAVPETLVVDDVTHLRWSFGTPRVLLLGHHDTVWPIGTLATHPWSIENGIARGPGVFDMKGGLVQMFHALASLPSLDGIAVLVTGDEEVGSPTSRELILESVGGCAAAFVLEASADGGALKVARKGVSRYEIAVTGKAAHSGLNPEKGVNAAVEAAHQILAISALGAQVNEGRSAPFGPEATTITPTLVSAGSSRNTVPAHASICVDVRAASAAAQRQVDALLRGLPVRTPGARLTIAGGASRPPLERHSSAELFTLAQKVAARLGMAPLREAAVGGASDGNLTAGAGCPTLDGLGAVGGGAHADDEHLVIDELPVRATLLAELIAAARG
ncbi:M20/M25/M40 family metallo-hydrolase [Streptomyces albipurpureus]|uniref:M20/M25/M40 family metallo-hydrolase n=1 Tax=Streptomyces albipurpureus TaxID=2897419 RepID=A0ABT0UZ76_9ACTN|nr:M20/M25/M40 family metallo-hydrolase [Streptomyces sp. CWNU-1]MCM2393859.1 M20/M25/M40 family metallo-hydrolase [Streptomyces sp. CWNU-1]